MDDEEGQIEEQKNLTLEQVKDETKAEVKKVLIEVCCGENSKLAAEFKEQGGEAIRLYLPKHDVSKDHTIEGLKRAIDTLTQEGFEVKIWISVPRYPWSSWRRSNLKKIPNFEEKLKMKREEPLVLIRGTTMLVEETKCEPDFGWPEKNDGRKNPTV